MNTRPEPINGWRRVAVVLFSLLVCSLWLGCSERKHYKLLSFFFDGVPDPNASLGPGWASQPGQAAAARGYPHKPYEEGNCRGCHISGEGIFFEVTTVDSSVCLTCHQRVLGAYAVMHGPVEAKACLWCHAPHGSPFKGMLRAPGSQLCAQCHDQSLLGSKPPEHRDPKADCLNCHVGHGSMQRYLLRADLPTTQPTTAPADAGGRS